MNKMDKNATLLLVPFLRKLADGIEKNTLTDEQIFKIGEFFISFLFQQDANKTEDEEFMKFLTLGWFVYKQIIPNL